jgi:hypothetical protein
MKAREPTVGSFELVSLFNAIFGALNLGLPVAKELASKFLEEWWKAVIARFSGKPGEAQAAIEAMVAMNRDHLAARDAHDARRHEEAMAFMDLLRVGIAGQQRATEHFVTPIGQSVEQATVFPSIARPVAVTTPDAEAIRDAAKADMGSSGRN